MGFPDGTVAVTNEVPQIVSGKVVVLEEDAPAHIVEKYVGRVMRARDSIAGRLESIGASEILPEASFALASGAFETLRDVGIVH